MENDVLERDELKSIQISPHNSGGRALLDRMVFSVCASECNLDFN